LRQVDLAGDIEISDAHPFVHRADVEVEPVGPSLLLPESVRNLSVAVGADGHHEELVAAAEESRRRQEKNHRHFGHVCPQRTREEFPLKENYQNNLLLRKSLINTNLVLFRSFELIRSDTHQTTVPDAFWRRSDKFIYCLKKEQGGSKQGQFCLQSRLRPGDPELQPPICDRFYSFNHNLCPFGTAGCPPYPPRAYCDSPWPGFHA